jgi:tetratricopeptide (TPR) repeat protein
LEAGRQWVGWLALGDRQFDDAVTYFGSAPESGWLDWAEGQRHFQKGQFGEAAAREQRAIDTWKTRPVRYRLGPQPDITTALSDLGGAQLLAGDYAAAIASLDNSLKSNPSNPVALYRRALAHDRQGKTDLALADYNMASRAAFAVATGEVASGEAHLYRGIMLYRRKDFARAENEFSSALNLEIPVALRPDAEAWRHLSAVATGACDSARWSLAASLGGVSPYFPKQEAMQTAANCH